MGASHSPNAGGRPDPIALAIIRAWLEAMRAAIDAQLVALLSGATTLACPAPPPPSLPTPSVAAGPRVADKVEAWLALRQRAVDGGRLAPSTLAGNREQMALWVVPRLGHLPLDALTVAHLRAWVRDIADACAPTTVRNIASTLRVYLDDCMAEGWCTLATNPARNPAFERELPDAETRAGRPLTFPLATAHALLTRPGIPPLRRVRYLLAFTTGLRAGELQGLDWAALALEAPVPHLTVRRALRSYGKGGKVEIGPTKTKASKRVVPLHPCAVPVLLWWQREGWAQQVRRAPRPADPVLPTIRPREGGGLWTRPVVSDYLRSDLAALGLPTRDGDHALQFRHTRNSFLTWLAAAGVPLEIRQRLAGHRPDTVTEHHYTAIVLQPLQAEVAKLPMPEKINLDPTPSPFSHPGSGRKRR